MNIDKETYKKEWCDNLKLLRLDIGLSQKKVADRMGIAVSTYANWEQGRTEPSIVDIKQICMALCISADELFNFYSDI